jgi:hypothetical protein
VAVVDPLVDDPDVDRLRPGVPRRPHLRRPGTVGARRGGVGVPHAPERAAAVVRVGRVGGGLGGQNRVRLGEPDDRQVGQERDGGRGRSVGREIDQNEFTVAGVGQKVLRDLSVDPGDGRNLVGVGDAGLELDEELARNRGGNVAAFEKLGPEGDGTATGRPTEQTAEHRKNPRTGRALGPVRGVRPGFRCGCGVVRPSPERERRAPLSSGGDAGSSEPRA